MATRKQAGFTLLELVLVMAISATMLLIVFAGQRNVRSRAQFDGTMNTVASSLANAYSKSNAAVNTPGNGLTHAGDGTGIGSVLCVAPPGTKYIFAGVAWSATGGSPATIQLNYYAAQVNAVTLARVGGNHSCIFNTETVNLPSQLSVAPANTRILFIRDDLGGLFACQSPAASATPSKNSFAAGVCAPANPIPANFTLVFSDADGHSSTLQIDPDGLAKRLN